MKDRIGPPRRRRTEQSLGQSLTEFALVIPLLALMALMGLDFGRAFESWVRIQQSAQVAANFASVNPSAWNTPGSATLQAKYQTLVLNESQGLDCSLSGPIAAPAFPSGTGIGLPVTATVTCGFHLLTPIISAILPNPLTLSAHATFPVRTGPASGISTGGSAPGATFTTSPYPPAGLSPRTLAFIDQSSGHPTAWCWNFGDPTSSTTCDSTLSNPAHTYTCYSGSPCSYTAGLKTTSVHGSSSWSYLTFLISSPAVAIPSFTISPGASGPPPLPLQFNDTTASNPSGGIPTSWCWNFGDSGSAVWPACDTTLQNPSHQYNAVGAYLVRLCAYSPGGPASPCIAPAQATVTVGYAPVASFNPVNAASRFLPYTVNFTDTSTNNPTSWLWAFGAGQGSSIIKNPSYTYPTGTSPGTYTVTLTVTNAYGSTWITHPVKIGCIVPNFVGDPVNTAANITSIKAKWGPASGAFFTGLLSFSPSLTSSGSGGSGHTVKAPQSLAAGSVVSCSSTITLPWS